MAARCLQRALGLLSQGGRASSLLASLFTELEASASSLVFLLPEGPCLLMRAAEMRGSLGALGPRQSHF